MRKHYDILESGKDILWFPGIGLLVFVCCLTLIIFFYKNDRFKTYRSLIVIGSVISFLWTIITWISFGSKYYQCIDSLESHTFSTVEGYVEEFNPMPKEGHQNETFVVKGVKFEYSDYEPSCGFNNSKSHGGPIDQGKYVKINYFEDLIIQLWIKQ